METVQRVIPKTSSPRILVLSTGIASCGLLLWLYRRQRHKNVKYAIGMEKTPCKVTTFEEALQDEGAIFIDVRSPKEFGEGHAKGACNVPLMSDYHRHLIGWTYAHKSRAMAIATGWHLFRPPLMRALLDKVDHCLRDRNGNKKTHIYVYCWRGGMRSRIVTNLLGMNEYEHVVQVKGGYKYYMNQIIWKGFERLSQHMPLFLVLFGNTGTRKTEILHALHAKGYPVLDLEGLAGHKGSVYGAVDEEPRNHKQFSVLLYHELERLKHFPFIFVEGEARKIGNSYLPDFVYDKIQNDKKILITAKLESRVQCLQRQYLATDDSVRQLHEVTDLEIVNRRIGKKNVEALHQMLDSKDYTGFAEWLLVNYYDIRYRFAKQEYTYDLETNSDDLGDCCRTLISFYEELCNASS